MGESILVLEDDPTNLQIIADVLRSYGYEVFDARTARDAIEMCADHIRTIHLLVTDVGLSDGSGTQVALEVIRSCPQMAVLFISGTPIHAWSTADLSNFDALRALVVDFLEKPFRPSDLESRVRRLLDRRTRSFRSGQSLSYEP